MELVGLNEGTTLRDFEAITGVEIKFVACDACTSERRILDSQSCGDVLLADALRATTSVPLAVRPWPVAGSVLIDGAVVDPYPVDLFDPERTIGLFIPLEPCMETSFQKLLVTCASARACKELRAKTLAAPLIGVVSISIDAQDIGGLFQASEAEIRELRRLGCHGVKKYAFGAALAGVAFELLSRECCSP